MRGRWRVRASRAGVRRKLVRTILRWVVNWSTAQFSRRPILTVGNEGRSLERSPGLKGRASTAGRTVISGQDRQFLERQRRERRGRDGLRSPSVAGHAHAVRQAQALSGAEWGTLGILQKETERLEGKGWPHEAHKAQEGRAFCWPAELGAPSGIHSRPRRSPKRRRSDPTLVPLAAVSEGLGFSEIPGRLRICVPGVEFAWFYPLKPRKGALGLPWPKARC